MKNIRIWSDDDKRCEAVWVAQLLTLCGCQVWKGRITGETHHYLRTDAKYILLLGTRGNNSYLSCINRNNFERIIVSGIVEKTAFLRNDSRVLGRCDVLDINNRESLESLMNLVDTIICEDSEEKLAILRLTHSFTKKKNRLSQAIYTITELFCSRKINYAKYDNVEVLIQAISDIKEWLENYVRETTLPLTYAEMFMIVYLQNLVDEGYIKARKTGGYDTSKMFRDANFLLNNEPEADAVHFLKLQILHNSINFSESPEDILAIIERICAPEYVSGAFGEVGDIYREEPKRVSRASVSDYYKRIDVEDEENYRNLYRAGLVYETQGDFNFVNYEKARKEYNQVVELIEEIDLCDRTPQEFEYLYKAYYGNIKMSIKLDKIVGGLTLERRETYRAKLTELIMECANFKQIRFLKKMYGESEKGQKFLALMSEKMVKVQNLAKELLEEL